MDTINENNRTFDVKFSVPNFTSIQRNIIDINNTFTNISENFSTEVINSGAIINSGNVTIGGTLSTTGLTTLSGGAVIDTSNASFTVSGSNPTHIISTADEDSSISLTTNGGTHETLYLHSEQGTSATSINIVSDVGGVTLSSGLSTSHAINLTNTHSAGGITISSGENNTNMSSLGSTVINSSLGTIINSTSGSINIGTDATDSNINIGTIGNRGIDIGGGEDTMCAININAGAAGMTLASFGGLMQFTSDSGLDINSLEFINIGNNTDTSAIHIGTAPSAREISIGNSTTTTGVNIYSGSGGISESSNGQFTIFSSADQVDAIKIYTNAGNSQTISLHALQSNTSDSINIVSDNGGITLNADGNTTISNNAVIGGNLSVSGSSEFAGLTIVGTTSINATGDATTTIGNSTPDTTITGSTLTLNGTDTLNMNVNGGSVNIGTGEATQNISIGSQNESSTLVLTSGGGGTSNYSTGQISLISICDEPTSILITTNGGTDETLALTSNQGTSASSVNINSTHGGITLTAAGNTTITNNEIVGGTLTVDGNTTVGGTLGVTGATTLSSTLNAGATTISSLIDTGDASIGGTLAVTGTTTFSGALNVSGNETVGGTLGVTGGTTLGSTLNVSGATSLSTTLGVTGTSTLGAIGVIGTANINTAGTATTYIGGSMNMNVINGTTTSITSIRDTPNSVYLRANGGTTETITLRSNQGTGANAINIVSDNGGITLNASGNTTVTGNTVLEGTLTVQGNIISNGSTITSNSVIQEYTYVNITQNPADGSHPALNITQSSSATAPLFKIVDSETTSLFEIDQNGDLNFGNGHVTLTNATGTTAINCNSTTITSAANTSNAIYLHANGGASENIQITSAQGTGSNAIALIATAGGITATSAGPTTITSTNNGGSSIYLHANGGTSESIQLTSTQGTTTNAIALTATAGGITTTSAGPTTITSTNNGGSSIYLHANGGTSESIQLTSTQGTTTNAIALTATAGGITETSAGPMTLTSTSNATNAIYLHTNGGSSESIQLTSTQGTGSSAIGLIANAGGITLSSAGSTSITSVNNSVNSVYLHANGGSSESVKIYSQQGTDAASINVISDHGGITLTASGNTTVTNNLSVGGTTSSSGIYQGGYLLVPTGTVLPYAISSAPGGYLLCDGSAYSRTTYATLFGVIGTTFGSGNGTTTFNIPNMVDRSLVGAGNNYSVGSTGGNSSITLSSSQMPSHTHTGTTDASGTHSHTINDDGHTHAIQNGTVDDQNFTSLNGQTPPADGNGLAGTYGNGTNSSTTGISINSAGSHTHTFTTNSAGSGSSINIMNPYIGLSFIIKY